MSYNAQHLLHEPEFDMVNKGNTDDIALGCFTFFIEHHENA
jgi:hypothetical protein